MNMDDLILVSIDDHVIEPADMFVGHMPKKYADIAPRVESFPDGSDRWVFLGESVGTFGICAVASWPPEEWGYDAAAFAEMRPGCYDIHARVDDMNANGVAASMCFPTMAGFNGRAFFEANDPDLGLIVLKAYNDWHIDEWCATYPGRFIPLAILPLWDVEAAAAEVRRVAAKGCRAVSFPETPHALGLPSLHTDHWDPLITAVVENDMAMCLHIGVAGRLVKQAPEAPTDVVTILSTQLSVMVSNDLLWGPVFRKFPTLRVALSEGGIGWIPYYLERCDRHYLNRGRYAGQDFGDKLPSDVFREHVLACFITDLSGLRGRYDIDPKIIAWECDFPHSDSNWPKAPELLMDEINAAGVPDDEIRLITYRNACDFFRFDLFEHFRPTDLRVAALRSQAGHVETRTVSRSEWRQRYAERTGVALQERDTARVAAHPNSGAHPNG